MITAVAFCPEAPVLIPALAQGAAPELDDLRAACRTAIRRVAAPGVQVVVVGAGPAWGAFEASSRGTLAGFGLPLEIPLGADGPGPLELPPALTVGAWLVRDALGADSGARGFAVGPGPGHLPDFTDHHRCALVVMGDGSARRSEKAPGHLDERAAGFDAAVARALAAGRGSDLDGEVLANDSGADLLVSGLPAWAAVSPLLAPVAWDAELLYSAAPYGVGYLVAAWTRRG